MTNSLSISLVKVRIHTYSFTTPVADLYLALSYQMTVCRLPFLSYFNCPTFLYTLGPYTTKTFFQEYSFLLVPSWVQTIPLGTQWDGRLRHRLLFSLRLGRNPLSSILTTGPTLRSRPSPYRRRDEDSKGRAETRKVRRLHFSEPPSTRQCRVLLGTGLWWVLLYHRAPPVVQKSVSFLCSCTSNSPFSPPYITHIKKRKKFYRNNSILIIRYVRR